MQADPKCTLPEPDEDSRRHSQRVARRIRDSIDARGGSISFAEFMQLALYAPGLGYYTSGNRKFGEAGDFITAPELSPLFARVLAKQAASVMARIDRAQILELGAGSGALAVDLCRRLTELDAMPPRYCILEISAELQQRQQETILQQLPGMFGNFTWLDRLPERFSGVVIANEVADALPVERFVRQADGVQQLRVIRREQDFAWAVTDAPALLREAVGAIEQDVGRQLEDGYTSEVSLGLPRWIRDICGCIDEGFMFLFDYGVSRRDYYAIDRAAGWLRCHFRHRAHSDPLILPGIQDLTAWVDFTAIAAAASRAGMEVSGYVTQRDFLLGGGIDDELRAAMEQTEKHRIELLQQIKMLTLPGAMGENFKCIGLAKGDIVQPGGFAFGDRAHVL